MYAVEFLVTTYARALKLSAQRNETETEQLRNRLNTVLFSCAHSLKFRTKQSELMKLNENAQLK